MKEMLAARARRLLAHSLRPAVAGVVCTSSSRGRAHATVPVTTGDERSRPRRHAGILACGTAPACSRHYGEPRAI